MKFIANNLISLRKMEGLTQAELSHRLDIPQSTYASYEYGKAEPNTEMQIKISEFYKVDLLAFLTTDLSIGKLIDLDKNEKINTKGKLIGKGKGKLNYQNEENNNLVREAEDPYIILNNQVNKMEQIIAAKNQTIASLERALTNAEKRASHAETLLEDHNRSKRKAG